MANAQGFQPSSKSSPCPICGNVSGHCKSKDGDRGDILHYCHNHATNPGRPIDGYKFLKPAGDWGIFVMSDSETRQTQPRKVNQKPAPKSPKSLSHQERDAELRAFMKGKTLHPDDRADLHRRGITDEQIAAWGVVSIEGKQPGYLCPCYSPDGLIVGSQWRLRIPVDGTRYKWVSWIGDGSKNSGELPLTVHRPIGVTPSGIAICEGIGAKSFILAERSGMVAIGAGSVAQFASSPKHWEAYLSALSTELGTTQLNFYPDSGSAQNGDVAEKYLKFFRFVMDLGYTIQIAWWDGQQPDKGADLDVISASDFGKITFISVSDFETIANDFGSIFKASDSEKSDGQEPKDDDLWYSKHDGAPTLKAVSEIALILKERWQLSYDPYTQNLYHYGLESDGLWSACEDTEIKKLIQGALQETGLPHAPSKVNAIFEYLKVELSDREWKKTAPKNLLPLRNGVFDINAKTLHPHSPEHRFTSQLPHEYNSLATCKPIIEWISQTQNGDPQRVQLLRAYLKAGVIGAASLQRFLELIGPGGAGKSTYANLMIALIGRENCYVTSIEELEQNRFATASIYGKRLVYIVDADGYNKTLSKFKALTGQDVLPFERKNKDSKTGFTYQGMVIYVANTPLASSDNTSGLERRRLTVPFSNQIPLGKQRPLIEFNDDGSVSGDFVPYLPGLLNWALEMSDAEMFELVKNTAVSVPSLSAAKIDVLTASNSLAAWLEDCCIFAPGSRSQIGTANKIQVTREVTGGDRITKSEYQNEDIWLYASYRAYCERTGHSKPVTMRKFSDSLVDLCRNQLKNLEVDKTRGRDGAAIVGLVLRQEGDTVSPTPIGSGTAPQTEGISPKTEETAHTPDEVWASIDSSLKSDITIMVEEVWGYASQSDRDFIQSFGDWVARHSKKTDWQKLRAETWRYLKSTNDGRAIARRLKTLEKQNHSHAAAA